MEKLFIGFSQETLANELKKELFLSKDLLEKRYVVVDSYAMKNYLMEFLAGGKEKICCGIQFIDAHELLSFFENHLEKKDFYFPSQVELFFSLVSHLRKALSQDKQSSLELHGYFPTSLSKEQKKRRLFQLASCLSRLFFDYCLYGKDLDSKWKDSDDWQKKLYTALFSEAPFSSYQTLNRSPVDGKRIFKKGHFHLFCLSYLPPLYHQMIEKFFPYFSFSHYEFSPTDLYWGEESSDRQIRRLTKKAYSMGGSKTEIAELETYLHDRNPLVANLGKMGQRYFSLFDEKLVETVESFSDREEIRREKTLLSQLQEDLFKLVNPDETRELSFSKQDDSLFLSVLTTRLREVELLKENICRLLDQKKYLPSEILVLVVDIETYLPVIEEVFERNDQKIPYRIPGKELKKTSDFAKALSSFFSLATSRFEKSELFSLFQKNAFRKKMDLCQEDLFQFKEWVESANIIWGRDEEHCLQEVKRSSFPFLHTWERGLKRVTLSLASIEEQTQNNPFIGKEIEIEDLDLFSKFLRIYQNLSEDMKNLSSDPEYTLKEWSQILRSLVETYFEIDEKDPQERAAMDLFLGFLRSLTLSHQRIEEDKFSLSLILPHIEKLFLQKTPSPLTELEAIRFLPFEGGSLYPAKAIFCIGMGENCPGYEDKNDLDLMGKEPHDFFFRIRKEERLSYLFLQLLCNAKESLHFSYVGIAKEDGKLENPSFFLSDLFSYLERCYGFSVLEWARKIHPSCGFHSSYFSSTHVSYSRRLYRAALSHYSKEKEKKSLMSFGFSKKEGFSSPFLENVPLQALQKLMKNPLQLFTNETLGIYLKEEKSTQKEKEALISLSFLDHYLMRSQFRHHSIEELIDTLEKQGDLPGGMMGEVAKKELEKNYFSYLQTLEEAKIKKEDLFSIILQEGCYEPRSLENGDWVVPAIEIVIEGRKRKVVGTIPELSPQGLLFWGEGKLDDQLRAWPLYLAYLLSTKQLGNFSTRVLFMKKGKEKIWSLEDPLLSFSHLLTYFDQAKKSPSPLLSSWADSFLKKEEKSLDKKIEETFCDEFLADKYLSFLLPMIHKPSGSFLLEEWGEFLNEKLFSQGFEGEQME